MEYRKVVIQIRVQTAAYVKKRLAGEEPRNLAQFKAWVLDVHGCGKKIIKEKLESLEITEQMLNEAIYND